jgi:hypothetical protein
VLSSFGLGGNLSRVIDLSLIGPHFTAHGVDTTGLLDSLLHWLLTGEYEAAGV